MLLLTLVVGLVGGCSSSSSSDSPSKFVGLWRMSLASDASDPGFDWRFNADQTTIVLYENGSTERQGERDLHDQRRQRLRVTGRSAARMSAGSRQP